MVDATGAVFGEAPNVAARVQSLAEPGSVIITAAVHRQVAGLFIAEDLGLHGLRGVQTPVALYRIVRASSVGRHGGRALTPLVGREEELELLGRRWEQARAGKGRLVLVTGEPGIGKSRLIQEFRAQLGETPHTWVEWSSSQLLQNTPLHPIVEWGRLRFGGAEASDEQRLADLEKTLRSLGLDPAEYAPLMELLVEGPQTGDLRAEFAPEELRRRQLTAITVWILAAARSQPIVARLRGFALGRSELARSHARARRAWRAGAVPDHCDRAPGVPAALERAPASQRDLFVSARSPRDRADGRRQLALRFALSPEVIEGVSERSGGVPLFVEEVTRLLLERGVAGGALAIPPTLQQSLAARLDRLGPAREIAQIGAVLGRDFPYALLQAVADDRRADA